MVMTAALRVGVAVFACGVLSACAGTHEQVTQGGGDHCDSFYDVVATAPTWDALKEAMVRDGERGKVASVRTQAQGDDIGVGDQDAVRVVDLLDRHGRRLVQVEIWRTGAGAWRAGVWNQCTD
jgi:hypothetical protein